MNIGTRIRLTREELAMSQDELARLVGYKSRSSVNKIELDGRKLPQEKIAAFARALGVTPSYLMGWEEKKTTAPRIDLSLARVLKASVVLNDAGRQMVTNYATVLKKTGEYDREYQHAAHGADLASLTTEDLEDINQKVNNRMEQLKEKD